MYQRQTELLLCPLVSWWAQVINGVLKDIFRNKSHECLAYPLTFSLLNDQKLIVNQSTEMITYE